MYKALALILILGGGYLIAETAVPSEHNQLQNWFDGSRFSSKTLYLAEASASPSRSNSMMTPESAPTPIYTEKPKSISPAEAARDRDSCEEDLLLCAKRNWRWLVITTVGGITAFLLNKFITVAVEGGPVLTYGLLLAGFVLALGLIFLVSYLLSRKKKKSD